MRTTTTILSGLLIINLAVTAMLYYKYYPGAESGDMAQANAKTLDNNRQSDKHAKSKPERDFNIENYGPVYATVNDLPVRQLELLPYLAEIMPVAQFKSLKRFDEIPDNYLEQATQSIAIDALLDNAARANGMYADTGLQSAIRQYERRYMRAAYLNSITPTLVTDEQIKHVYDKLAADLKGKQEYHAHHILLATEQEARAISDALVKKQLPFVELAKKHSLDNTSNYKGGDLGFNIEGSLHAQFESVISKLPLKQYSAPFKTDLGWHIAIVDERRPSTPLPYEQTAPAIRTNLEQQAMNAYVDKIISDASIKVNALDVGNDAMTEPVTNN